MYEKPPWYPSERGRLITGDQILFEAFSNKGYFNINFSHLPHTDQLASQLEIWENGQKTHGMGNFLTKTNTHMAPMVQEVFGDNAQTIMDVSWLIASLSKDQLDNVRAIKGPLTFEEIKMVLGLNDLIFSLAVANPTLRLRDLIELYHSI